MPFNILGQRARLEEWITQIAVLKDWSAQTFPTRSLWFKVGPRTEVFLDLEYLEWEGQVRTTLMVDYLQGYVIADDRLPPDGSAIWSWLEERLHDFRKDGRWIP